MAAEREHVFLLLRSGGQNQRIVVWDTQDVTVGRAPGNDVVVDDPEMSRNHACFRKEQGQFVVDNLSTSNPTLVNGEPLTPMIARALQPEDSVQIEKIAIQARWSEAAVVDDAESTYHEMARPASLAPSSTAAPPPPPSPQPAPPSSDPTVAIPSASPPPEPPLPVPAAPAAVASPPVAASGLPVARPERPSPRSDLERAAQLAQPSFSDALATARPQDIAAAIEYLTSAEQRKLFHMIQDMEVAAEVMASLNDESVSGITSAMSAEQLVELFDYMEADDATDVVEVLPEDLRNRVLARIRGEEDQDDLPELLAWPSDSAEQGQARLA